MRLAEVFRYEVAHRLRSASTWIYAGILFLLAAVMFLATADGPASAHINAPERIAGASVIVGMLGMLVTAGLMLLRSVRAEDREARELERAERLERLVRLALADFRDRVALLLPRAGFAPQQEQQRRQPRSHCDFRFSSSWSLRTCKPGDVFKDGRTDD